MKRLRRMPLTSSLCIGRCMLVERRLAQWVPTIPWPAFLHASTTHIPKPLLASLRNDYKLKLQIYKEKPQHAASAKQQSNWKFLKPAKQHKEPRKGSFSALCSVAFPAFRLHRWQQVPYDDVKSLIAIVAPRRCSYPRLCFIPSYVYAFFRRLRNVTSQGCDSRTRGGDQAK